MAQIDARDYIFEIQDTSQQTETWVEIDGLENFELDPSENNEDTETTKFRSRGYYSGQMMQRGASCEIEGKEERDETDPSKPDPGQALVDAAAEKVGNASLVPFRFRHESDDEWVKWTAYVEGGSKGGGNNDKSTWGATFTRSGKPVVMAVV